MKARSLNLVERHHLMAIELPDVLSRSHVVCEEPIAEVANQNAAASASGKVNFWPTLVRKITRWIIPEPDFETWHRLEFRNEYRNSRSVRDINLHRWY